MGAEGAMAMAAIDPHPTSPTGPTSPTTNPPIAMVVMEAVAMAVAAEEAMDMAITRASHNVKVMSMVILRHDFSKSLDDVTPT